MLKKIKTYRTSYLYSRPNYLIGCGSIFNISGKYFLFNYSKTDSQADSIAIENDWGVIGQDIKNVIKKKSTKQLESIK